jgi:hypothetical protein
MNGSSKELGWGARLLIGLTLVLIGAAAATWGLAHYEPAARFLGVARTSTALTPKPLAVAGSPPAPSIQPVMQGEEQSHRLSELESRLARVETATQQAQGSAGRADALVVAFAARRAIDRGVALGYLENLLTERFGPRHQQAVATIITASHQPVRLNDLIADYERLGPDLRRGGPNESWWASFQRELGGLVQVHSADRPSTNVEARYNRASQRLAAGEVDQALAETMRLPGASAAGGWTAKARRYIAAHRALDEIESAALLTGPAPAA